MSLLRQARNNRSTIFVQLLYRWKLIGMGEELCRKVNAGVSTVSISNGYVKEGASRNMLVLLSNVSIKEKEKER